MTDNTRKPLWDRLMEYYTEEEALLWLSSPQPLLSGATPAAMLAREQPEVTDDIHRLLDGLDACAYV